MSNRSGRSWYRLSSIVRPTAHSSRDPSSPHNVIEPPLSPPNEVQEANPSPVLSPRWTIKNEPPKRRHEGETTSPVLSSSRSTKNEPPNQQQQTSYMDQSHQTGNNNKNKTIMSQASHPPPQLMSPPLRPPSAEKVQEAELTPNHDPPVGLVNTAPTSHQKTNGPPKPREEHETTHQKNILTLSEETEVVHGPNETLLLESDGEVLMSPQSVITISGENKGAVMEIIHLQSPSIKTHKSEEKSKNHNNNGENRFVNSNVQIVNGSVVYNSSEIHHDPGVHLILDRKPSSGEGFIMKDLGNGGYTSSNN